MGSVTISHVIGTVSLITVFLVVSTHYTLSFSSLQNQITEVQLDRVANYIASNMIDMISLCSISDNDQLITKKLHAPADARGSEYSTKLIIAQDIEVSVFITHRPTIRGTSILPWATDANVTVYNTENQELEDFITNKNPSLNPCVSASSGSPNLVLWCLKVDDKIVAGLGTLND